MDPHLLRYYERELAYMREMGGEFARAHPKIAGRLGLDGLDCSDPYVERLLEGFAFLAGRVQLKIDAEFPRFTQHLLESVLPGYLAPTPSMAVVQFQPDLTEGALADGVNVPRDSVLRSRVGKGDNTACEYRTAHALDLWPLEIAEAEYYRYASTLDVPEIPGTKAALRIRLRAAAGLSFDAIALDRLPLYLVGSDAFPMRLYELLLAHTIAMVIRPVERPAPWRSVIDDEPVRRVGFSDSEALLPCGPRSFHGYRLLREYFAFPDRFRFVELTGLRKALRQASESELDVVLLFDQGDSTLEGAVDGSKFALHCTPAINLFPRRADQIHLSDKNSEYHVVPDRTRPLDFEVHEVTEVVGRGAGSREQAFLPFYASNDFVDHDRDRAYYAVHRVPRLISARRRGLAPRSSYIGSELFLSLVDAKQAPYSTDLRQLALNLLCTNRDLPLQMPVGQGATDFTMVSGAPVVAVKCVAGPTRPRPSVAQGETAWRLVSHLALNYLSLLDTDERRGAAALRDLLMLYAEASDTAIRQQVEGVKEVRSQPITRRILASGRIAFARGLEITVNFDEVEFTGTGVFLLGAVLEQFFAKYVSINSFTETVVRTLDRGEIMRWPMRIGLRHAL